MRRLRINVLKAQWVLGGLLSKYTTLLFFGACQCALRLYKNVIFSLHVQNIAYGLSCTRVTTLALKDNQDKVVLKGDDQLFLLY